MAGDEESARRRSYATGPLRQAGRLLEGGRGSITQARSLIRFSERLKEAKEKVTPRPPRN